MAFVQNTQQRRDFSIVDKISIGLLGYRTLFDLKSLNFLTENKKAYPQIKKDIEKCQKQYTSRVLTILFLTGAFALSVRRYFPSIYSSVSASTITIDLAIGAIGLTFGAGYASNAIQQSLNKLITQLIKQKDRDMIQFITQFEKKYKVSSKHLASIATDKKSQTNQLASIIQQQIKSKKKADQLV